MERLAQERKEPRAAKNPAGAFGKTARLQGCDQGVKGKDRLKRFAPAFDGGENLRICASELRAEPLFGVQHRMRRFTGEPMGNRPAVLAVIIKLAGKDPVFQSGNQKAENEVVVLADCEGLVIAARRFPQRVRLDNGLEISKARPLE